MPQMHPMNWMLIFFMALISLYMITNYIYFSNFKNKYNFSKKYFSKKYKILW